MEILGLIIEFAFLLIGVQVYRFSIGRALPRDEQRREQAEAFRVQNKRWLKILSLLLVAIMIVEIGLHLYQLVTQSA